MNELTCLAEYLRYSRLLKCKISHFFLESEQVHFLSVYVIVSRAQTKNEFSDREKKKPHEDGIRNFQMGRDL